MDVLYLRRGRENYRLLPRVETANKLELQEIGGIGKCTNADYVNKRYERRFYRNGSRWSRPQQRKP